MGSEHMAKPSVGSNMDHSNPERRAVPLGLRRWGEWEGNWGTTARQGSQCSRHAKPRREIWVNFEQEGECFWGSTSGGYTQISFLICQSGTWCKNFSRNEFTKPKELPSNENGPTTGLGSNVNLKNFMLSSRTLKQIKDTMWLHFYESSRTGKANQWW